jgi:pimeloyl-ACP methyl ester carboxylesterase
VRRATRVVRDAAVCHELCRGLGESGRRSCAMAMAPERAGCSSRMCALCAWMRAATAELCRLLCCPPVPSRIAAKLAFVPPLPTYDIRQSKEVGGNGEAVYELWMPPRRRKNPHGMVQAKPSAERDGCALAVEWLRTTNNQFIPAILLRVPGSFHTLIFSHGNGTDLGQMYEFLKMLAVALRVDIFAYEYSGYGASSAARPGEKHTYWDAEAAWECLTHKYAVPPGRIVLYGQSVGSGPSCNLASRSELRPAGLILHSPMMSGLRVIMPVKRTLSVDPYPNIDLIEKVLCPVAVIHGRQDEVVPFSHGLSLHKAIADRRYAFRPLWVQGGGHNNIVSFREYYTYVQEFLAVLRHDGVTDIIRRDSIGARSKDSTGPSSTSAVPPSSGKSASVVSIGHVGVLDTVK